ncbi:hypothetical protein, variant [Aphanomyces astaci]|uniref:Uncharacterized protein n=1 Tax=Aphanomyces astaci TaxID=112090 RepID=W4HBV4_APHAT|nr:hypothetical protein, variant [Aphanomyces astaci]ETV88583.1 hypothetical protein, variant [Aphanomyces astaci]|eukprot:XP_009820983.1 hypothetical protein, variant [Aphanomyces astaci]
MLKCATGRPPRHLALGNQDVFHVPSGPTVPKWEKEFSVVFDGRKPTGLGFKPVKEEYACSVDSVVSGTLRDNLAADHNEHCYLSCDLSRVITPGLRVRAINDLDVQSLTFDVVVAKIKTMKRPILLTFADVRSATYGDPAASVPVESKQAAQALGDEVVRLRAQLQDAIMAKTDAEAESAKFQAWNKSLLMTNGVISDQNSAAVDEVLNERIAVEATHALATQLQGERDRAVAAAHAFKLENSSLQSRVENLHQRLEDAQTAKRETNERLMALERQRHDDLRLFASLHREIHVEADETNELDKLMQVEATTTTSVLGREERDKHEATMNKLREQRAAHATHKASLEAALDDHMARAAADRARIEKLQRDKDALERSILELPQQVIATPVDANQSTSASATVHHLHAQLGDAHDKVFHAKPETRSEKAKWTAEKLLLLARIQAVEHHSQALEEELVAFKAATSSAVAATAAADVHEGTIVRDFIHRMSTKGFRVHKHGRRGSTHDRYLYTDSDGHWLSWTKVDAARNPEAFRHPSKKIVVDIKDLVDVLPGKQTEVHINVL